MWDPERPEDFGQFEPVDMPRFLAWWERQALSGVQLHLVNAFVEGAVDPWLAALATGQEPGWVRTLLAWRAAAQWTYERGVNLSERLRLGMRGLVSEKERDLYQHLFRLTPADIAEVPPAIRQGFDQGSRFSLSWVKRLSDEARQDTAAILSAHQLRNINPKSAVPLLEQVLRRDKVAEALGIPVGEVGPEQIEAWVKAASQAELIKLGRRAELIAVTEGARMQNLGILSSLSEQGEQYVYVRPHAGSCPECQRLLDGKVFKIKTLQENMFKNFGVPKRRWVPAVPQHPRCRHSPEPVPVRFRDAVLRQDQDNNVPESGIRLRWYGLSSEKAMQSLGLPPEPDWLTP